MSKKYFILAVACTIFTILYYVWMICSWVNLDTVAENKESRANKNSHKNSNQFTWEDVDLENLPIIGEDLGEPPPNYAFWIKKPINQCDSVLKVNTSAGASYVVKIVDSYSAETVMMFYLSSGSSKEIEVPSGLFEIRYTSGTRWFGEDDLFGVTASYAKADRLFSFSEGSGYELTLYRVKNGNLRTSSMRKEDF